MSAVMPRALASKPAALIVYIAVVLTVAMAGATTFALSLPEQSDVRLVVYDVLACESAVAHGAMPRW